MLAHFALALALQAAPVGDAGSTRGCGRQALSDAIDRRFDFNQLRLDAQAALERQATKEMTAEAVKREEVNVRVPATALATSIATSSGAPIDQALLTPLLAFGIQSGLVEGDGKALTVSLSGAAIAKAFSPEIIDSTGAYVEASGIRRLGGKISLGGAGDRLDRDNDGEPDDALEAKALGDSIAWDVEYRVLGSRDRRDKRVAKRIIEATRLRLENSALTTEALLEMIRQVKPNACVGDLDALLERPDIAPLLQEFTDAGNNLHAAVQVALEEADRAPVLTAFAAGVSRKEELGPNKRSFGLRAIWGTTKFDHTVNASWNQQDGEAGKTKPTTVKLAYEASGSLFSSLVGEKTKTGLFASWEHFKNVPSAKYRNVAQFGGKVEIELSPGVKVPVTVKWINHRDLLSGSDDVIGNVGIAIDLADLKKKPAAN